MANHRRIFILVCITIVCLFIAINSLTIKQNVSTKPQKSSFQLQRFFGGTNQEVSVYFISGEEKGPTLLIIAGIHGDESGGYLTADCSTASEFACHSKGKAAGSERRHESPFSPA
jgi:hypothetical protein